MEMKIRFGFGLVAALAACSLARCGVLPTACTQELRVEVVPAEKTIRVGESFQATAEGVSCGGRQRFAYDRPLAWRTADASIVQVDSETGTITGLAPGTATVTAHEPTVSADWSYGSVQVAVRP
jgi:hypothetical protein